MTDASFVRAGIPSGTRMRLELDAANLQVTPGRLWTDALSPTEKLQASPLLPIPQLASDPLSTLAFGEGRVKNALALALVGDTQVFVVLSLMQSGDVEVRLLRGTSPGSLPADAGALPPQLFGVFALRRQQGDCGLP
ncbi:MAG: hypothetical protein NVS3B10_00760 [Polyangiales bacterium]